MSDGVPKSRVTLTYDTKVPEGREKPRELPFRLMVLGDVGGEKAVFKEGKKPEEWEEIPIDERKVRQLNGRNLGEVMKGFKIKLRDVPLDPDENTKLDVLIDSMASFTPNEVLRLITGQKETDRVHPMVGDAWHAELSADTPAAQQLWSGDPYLSFRWARREGLVGFQKSFQNSKKLRDALKAMSVAVDREEDVKDDELKTELKAARDAWGEALKALKTQVEAQLTARKLEPPKAPAGGGGSETEGGAVTTEETT